MTLTPFTNVKNVFLDIDDTLWENNIFFLQSLAALCTMGRELGHTDQATTLLLNQMEDLNIRTRGYGYDSYEASLIMTMRILVARAGREDMHACYHHRILQWTDFLRTHPIQWRFGVLKTLPVLAKHFRTVIVTKGHEGDQMAKVNRSGRKNLFFACEVVPHKYPSCYARLIAKYQLDPAETVMVGNSPRSDINMAKKAGLRTIYVPHPQTWYREMEPIETDGPPTIFVNTFDEVLKALGLGIEATIAPDPNQVAEIAADLAQAERGEL